MVREFELPDVGEGLTEAEIVRWLVEEGDRVAEDQPIVEVETDKAIVEVPAPVDGTVRGRMANEGDVVEVGDVFVTFDVADESTAEPAGGTAEDGAGDPDARTETGADGESEIPDDRVFAPPRVRRMAREEGIDLARIEGSGPGGRITAADVQSEAQRSSEPAANGGARTGRATEPGGATTESASAADTPRPGAGRSGEPSTDGDGGAATGVAATRTRPARVDSTDRDRTLAVPATRRVAREEGVDIDAVPATEECDGEAFVTADAVREYAEHRRREGESDSATRRPSTPARSRSGETRVPYDGIRRTIGDRMVQSKFTAPHVTHFDEAVVPELVETRATLEAHADDRERSLTYLPFVLLAVARALREHPRLNASLDRETDEIVRYNRIDIGVATATDDGLLVPVIEDVDRKGIRRLAAELDGLIRSARERTIGPEALQGSTFTVTNFGAIGGEYGTPIINESEAAILGLGRIDDRPVVENGTVVARPTLPLSLSFDHRIVDGADAARFTNDLIELLEEPLLLLEG